MTKVPSVDETALISLINDPSKLQRGWQARAVCGDRTSADPHPYFPDEGETPSGEALARCRVCPVAGECLATALVHEAHDQCRNGWWGGFSPAQRDELVVRLAISPVRANSDAELARRLRAGDMTISRIASEVGCTERTVYRYLAASAA